jgi:hypothetical protein
LVGKLTARSEAHVVRLSALYALLAQRAEITAIDIYAAQLLWERSAESVRSIFGERIGSATADAIAERLMPGESMTLTQIRKIVFANHVRSSDLEGAFKALEATGLYQVTVVPTPGRPVQRITRL